MYTLTLARFHPTAAQGSTFDDPEEVIEFLGNLDDDPCYVFVAHLAGGVDHGNFNLWRNQGRALVRLDEQSGHAGTHAAGAPSGDVEFLDEDGSSIRVAGARTVDARLGLEALRFWLRTGGKIQLLDWD
jgi:hypothetical protein